MSTAPSPDIWNNILKGSVEKDDPLWTEYLDKAEVFDVRMVDEWNKIVDVLLVYVALFIAVLTSFITNSSGSPQFQRNPADITNDLLVVIYNQLAVQSNLNNTPITPVDPKSYFNQTEAEYDAAVSQNLYLYVSLSLSIIVSVIALVAKLWLVSYSQQAFSVGSPYDRAMRRQEAYNGVLVWKMGAVINMLPVILLIALCLFGIYVFSSVWTVQEGIGAAVGIILGLCLMFLVSASICSAVLPGCPFRSPFSVIRFIVEMFQTVSKWIPRRKPIRLLAGAVILILMIAITTLSLYTAGTAAVSSITPIVPLMWILSLFFPTLAPFAVAAFLGVRDSSQDMLEKPQKYKMPYVAALTFVIVSVWTIIFLYFRQSLFSIPSYFVVLMLSCPFYVFFTIFIARSMADTGEIDAIAWLLITTPEYPATFFKKAGQMTGVGSIGRYYRPRLLESLMPLLSSLITSYHAQEHHNSDTHSPESDDVLNGRLRTNPRGSDMVPIDEDPQLKNLEIYIACLARLSIFTDYNGSILRLREDARRHPKLEQLLIDKLVELADPQRQSLVGLRSAAIKVLKNYELDMEGNPLRSPTTVLENVATDLRGEATSMLNDNELGSQEPGHSELYEPVGPSTRMEPATGTHVEPPSAATPMLNDSELNSQEQGHSELYRPVEDSQWTIIRRILGQPPRRVKTTRPGPSTLNSRNPNRLLTTDQAPTVEAAASSLTEHQMSSISRRQKISAYRESSLPSIEEGPSKSKGKTIDPCEWGQVNISLESLDIEAQDAALNSVTQVKKMTTHRKDDYYDERNPPASATRRRSRQASRPAESHPAAQVAKGSYLVLALNKDSSTRIEPATHVRPASEATSILNDSELNGRERGRSELYRPEDPATHIDPATHVEPVSADTSMLNVRELDIQEQGRSELYRPEDPAMRVEPVSAAASMFNDSELDSQEQGLPKLYRPVNPATRVGSEECEIGDEKIEEVKSQVGDEEIEEVKRD